MNKLEKYRDSITPEGIPFDHEWNYGNNMFKKGFDEAIALDLPVKFLKWYQSVNKIGHETRKKIVEEYGHLPEDFYKYWLENIFEP